MHRWRGEQYLSAPTNQQSPNSFPPVPFNFPKHHFTHHTPTRTHGLKDLQRKSMAPQDSRNRAALGAAVNSNY